MADTFTLDTSGTVYLPDATDEDDPDFPYVWSILVPFQQGYIEAAFAGACDPVAVRQPEDDFSRIWNPELDAPLPRDAAFSWLAPSTLSAMLTDCAALMEFLPAPKGDEALRIFGREVWAARQAGTYSRWPPVHLTIGEDGLIYLREAVQ